MVLSAVSNHPAGMTNSTVLTDRLSANRRIHRPLAVSGAAVLSLSMLLSVGTALGAANNGNGNGSTGNGFSAGTHGTSGNVKVHDVGTGVETSGTDNEPHVCAFWLGFEFDAPYEAGTWVVVSWAPTGDGSTVASGIYNTSGDGVDNSGAVALAAGHYRVEWAATGATSSKKKTFWVDADCGQPGSVPDEVQPPDDVTPPTDAPGSPDEESQPEELTPPTDAPGSPDEESQPEELVLSDQGTAPQDDEAPADEAPASDEEAPASNDEAPASNDGTPPGADEDVAPVGEPPSEDVTSPEDDSAAQEPADTDEGSLAGEGESGATDPGTPPSQDELGSTGSPEGPTMSDTAIPQAPVQGGALATLGLLLLIGAHAAIRRDRLIPATHN